MFDKLLNKLAETLHQIADKITPTSKPIKYLPPQPIGQITTRTIKGKKTFYLLYTDKDGKRKSQYLSRNKEKAEERREELSGWLLNE